MVLSYALSLAAGISLSRLSDVPGLPQPFGLARLGEHTGHIAVLSLAAPGVIRGGFLSPKSIS